MPLDNLVHKSRVCWLRTKLSRYFAFNEYGWPATVTPKKRLRMEKKSSSIRQQRQLSTAATKLFIGKSHYAQQDFRIYTFYSKFIYFFFLFGYNVDFCIRSHLLSSAFNWTVSLFLRVFVCVPLSCTVCEKRLKYSKATTFFLLFLSNVLLLPAAASISDRTTTHTQNTHVKKKL